MSNSDNVVVVAGAPVSVIPDATIASQPASLAPAPVVATPSVLEMSEAQIFAKEQ